MSKIFETNFENGSFIEKMSNIAITPSSGIIKVAKGYGLKCAVNSTYAINTFFNYSNISFVINTFIPRGTANFHLMKSTNGYWFSLYAGAIYFQDNISNVIVLSSIAPYYNKDISLVITFNVLNKTILTYINTILVKTTTFPTITLRTLSSGITLSTNVLEKPITYFKIKVYNTVLKQNDINNEYINFLNSKPINKPIIFNPNLNILKPNEIKDNGLIAAYNFTPVNGKLPNIAYDNPANGNNARSFDRTLTLAQTLKDSIFCNLKSTSTSLNFGNILSLQYIIKPSVLNQTLAKLNSSSNVNITSDGGIDVTGVSGEIVYINGSLTGIISVNTWNTISINLPSVLNANAYVLGNLNYSGLINFEKIYNRILSVTEIKNYHNQFAAKTILYEDFSIYPVQATKIGNWIVKSGSFIIAEDRTGKYLKCVTSGVIQLSNKDSDKLYIKKYTGNMALSKTSTLVKLTATSNQITRTINLTQGITV